MQRYKQWVPLAPLTTAIPTKMLHSTATCAHTKAIALLRICADGRFEDRFQADSRGTRAHVRRRHTARALEVDNNLNSYRIYRTNSFPSYLAVVHVTNESPHMSKQQPMCDFYLVQRPVQSETTYLSSSLLAQQVLCEVGSQIVPERRQTRSIHR
jgi:hypothetical protein